MKRTFNFGKIDFEGSGSNKNLVTVEIEYKTDGDKKVFSASAKVWNSRHTDIIMGGQCLDTIAPYMNNNPDFFEILRLWNLYHLNNMHPECEHQNAMGWHLRASIKVFLYHWRMTEEALEEKRKAEKTAIIALKCGETFKPTIKQRFFSSLDYSLTTYEEKLPKNIAKYYEPKKPLFAGDKGHKEEKLLGWLRESEHPDGILSKACPKCGYKYGSAWNYFPIPEDDEKIIINLLCGKKQN